MENHISNNGYLYLPITELLSSTAETNSIEKQLAAAAKSLQSCPTLCDPIDGSPPGSPIPGILQARTLEWVASSYSRSLELADFSLLKRYTC